MATAKTKSAATDVRRDRVAVLASTIIRELASARIYEIEHSNVDVPDPPVPMTAELRRLAAKYSAARKAMKQVEAAIDAKGFRVSCNDKDEAEVEWPYRRWDAKKEQRKAERARRCNSVRELRTSTLIDLVTLDEAKAKAVVSAFRAAVEKL